MTFTALAEDLDTDTLYRQQIANNIKSEIDNPNIAGNVTGVGLEIGTG